MCLVDVGDGPIYFQGEENAKLHNWMPTDYLAEYYAQSLSYVVQRWLESDLALPASEIANLYYYILNNSMEEILAKMR